MCAENYSSSFSDSIEHTHTTRKITQLHYQSCRDADQYSNAICCNAFFFFIFLSFNAHYLNDHWKCIKPLCIFQYAFFVCYFMRLINANFVKNLYGFVLTCVKSVFNMKRLHLWSEFRSSSLSTITLFLVFALLFFRILFPFQSFSPHLSYSLSFSPPHFSYSHSISFANSLLSCSSS